MKRQCFYIPELQFDGNGFIPSVVYEGEKGHHPMRGDDGTGSSPWYWGKTLAEAQEIARGYNERAGLSEQDVNEIVLSSMFAKTRRQSQE